jgi:hypothetical protein
VKLIFEQLLLLGLLTAPFHWIIARSEIAKPLWSRLTGWPAKLLACPACSGFWLGLALAVGGVRPVDITWPVGHQAVLTAEILAAGVLATLVTPVMQAVMLLGLHYSAVPVPEPEPEPAIDVTPADDSTPPPIPPQP